MPEWTLAATNKPDQDFKYNRINNAGSTLHILHI